MKKDVEHIRYHNLSFKMRKRVEQWNIYTIFSSRIKGKGRIKKIFPVTFLPQARFQQKQLEEKEEKLIHMLEEKQAGQLIF